MPCQSRQLRQIASRFGMPGAHQHRHFAHATENMAGLHDIAGLGIFGCGSQHAARTMAAEMPVVTPLAASIDTVKLVDKGKPFSRTISGRLSCLQWLRSESGKSARGHAWP